MWKYGKHHVESLHAALERHALVLHLLVGILLLSMLVANALEIGKVNVWRHDAVFYFASYLSKLIEEGRWINHIVFPWLQLLNPLYALALSFGCLLYFSYRCAIQLVAAPSAMLIALAAVQISPLYAVLHWPVTPLMSFMLLAAAAYFYNKMDERLFFLLFGVLFGGGFNHFYNLLPLLFLGRLCSWRQTWHLLAYWILGFVLGFCVTNCALYVFTGKFIQVSAWRLPNPIHSYADLIVNVQRAYGSLHDHVRLFGNALAVLLVSCGALYALFQRRRRPLLQMSIVLCVMLSCYAQAIPLGLDVYVRTAFPLYMGFLFILPICSGRSRLVVLFVSLICMPMYIKNTSALRYYTAITNTWYSQLKALPVDAALYGNVVFLSSDADCLALEQRIIRNAKLKNELSEGLGTAMRWVPVAQAAGFTEVVYGPKAIEVAARLAQSTEVVFTPTALYDYALSGDTLLIRFREALIHP